MKTIYTKLMLALTLASVLLLLCCKSVHMAQNEPVTYQIFYDKLSPYGSWIDYPNIGHVWSPAIQGDFRPYLTNGNWVATSEGWMWSSNYSWGWAPFHYGSWFYDNHFGWLWQPGYEWSPAWVVWGTTEDYYCWAPLMPNVDVTIVFDTWAPAPFYWNLCPHRHITRRRLHHVTVRGDKSRSGNAITHIRNYQQTSTRHYYYASGPSFTEVQHRIGTKINPIPLEETSRSPSQISSGRAQIYRPYIEAPETQRQNNITPKPNIYRRGITPVRPNTEGKVITRRLQRNNIKNLPLNRAEGRR